MDINDQVNQIVQGIVTQITTQVQQQAMSAIEQKIAEVIAAIDTSSMLSEKLSQKLDERLSRLPIDAKSIEIELTNRINDLSTGLATRVQSRSLELADQVIQDQVKAIDFPTLCQSTLVAAIQGNKLTFPDGSIPGNAINSTNLRISGSSIAGGIVTNFGSTGIDDKATACQLSIFDEVTVVENNLLTKDLTVKGMATIEGDLTVTGSLNEESGMYKNLVSSVSDRVKNNLDGAVYENYAGILFDKIKKEGLDLDKITVQGEEIINGSNLGNKITYSNLQRVGTLSELRVGGEALLSQSLFTTARRVGINTIEPAQALSVWDQEVEIGFGKRETNVAVIEAPRNQQLIIGVNGKNNLVLNTDGSVSLDKVSVGAVTLSSSSTPPNYDAAQGSIVFNSSPSLGGPLGWVSLGGARWANFGFID